MYRIENPNLSAAITESGVELASLIDQETGTEHIWQADPKIWGSHAPVLFPIIGALKDGTYTHQGKTYSLPKHGIVRGNDEMVVVAQSGNSITLELRASDKTQEMYPFDFVFRIRYRLDGRTLVQEHQVINTGKRTMYFSLGGHPAFRIPLKKGEKYSDYHLAFEHSETAQSHVVNSDGLIAAETVDVPWKDNRLPLSHDLFAKDALVFKTLKSRQVELVSKKQGTILTLLYPDFNYLGVWSKPKGDFVCIEPWLGIADAYNASGELAEKEGVLALKSKKEFRTSFRIRIA